VSRIPKVYKTFTRKQLLDGMSHGKPSDAGIKNPDRLFFHFADKLKK
jgi:hypothetical protein